MDFLTQMGFPPPTDRDINALNAVKLAYIGDAVYEQFIRLYLVRTKDINNHQLAMYSSKFVSAGCQFAALMQLQEEDFFTDEEWNMVLRGRNVKPKTIPKSSTPKVYRYATGLEALTGYLFLRQDHKRLGGLMQRVIEILEKKAEEDEKEKTK